MSSMIPTAIMQGANNASIRNQGGQSGFLGGPGAIDGSAQSFWNLADPANLSGNASSGHILSNILDPGNVFGQNQAANPLGPNGSNLQNGGVPSVLPNLGAQSMIPHIPQGGFMPLGQANPMGGNGGGIFNQMAANSAGPIFNPGSQFTPQPKGASQTPPASQLIQAGNYPLYSLGHIGMSTHLASPYNRQFMQR